MGESKDQDLTPGQMLRAAREAKGLTVAQVSAATRIAEPLLTAIEGGDHSVLPPLYVRSFLRSYAGAVGLSHEEVVGRWDRLTDGAGSMRTAPAEAEGPAVEVRRIGPGKGRLVLRWLLVAIIVAAIIILAVRALDRAGRDAFSAGDPPRAAPAVAALARP